MTVAPVVTETVYALAGTNIGPFATVWPYAVAADVAVFLTIDDTSTLLANGADYTLTGASPLTGGGQVTLNAALPGAGWAAGASLCVARNSQTGQPSALGEALKFSPAAWEGALDFDVRQVQDLWGPARRALGMAPGGVNYTAMGRRVRHMADGVAADDAASYGQLGQVSAQLAALIAERDLAGVKIMFSSAFPIWPGEADDTRRAQRMLDAAGDGGVCVFESGQFNLSATLNAHSNQVIQGAGPNSTIFKRETAYGDTLKFVQAAASIVRGIWFWHGNFPANTGTALTGVAADGSAHINMVNGQGWTVEDCWLWRMPYGIRIGQGAIFRIRHNIFSGVYDRAQVAAQEGLASVYVGADAYTQIGQITENYFAGMGSVARNITWTATDGAPVTVSITNNCGPIAAIQIAQCEDLQIKGNYIGGSSFYNIVGGLNAGAVALEWRILDNMFDSAGPDSPMILIQVNVAGVVANGVSIKGNQFNGETVGYQAISFTSSVLTQPAVANFVIANNTCQALVGTFCSLGEARGGVIANNSITDYNCRNVSAGADVNFCAAVWGSDHATGILAIGNVIGGTANLAGSPSFCYQGVVGAGIAEVATVYNAAGAGGTGVGKVGGKVVKVAADTNYTMTGVEDVVLISNTGAVNTSVLPPPNPVPGFVFTLKDAAGTWGVGGHGCQFAETVDGAATPLYVTAYETRRLMYVGPHWADIGN